VCSVIGDFGDDDGENFSHCKNSEVFVSRKGVIFGGDSVKREKGVFQTSYRPLLRWVMVQRSRYANVQRTGHKCKVS
jgi:hypothetical protein